MTEPPDLPGIHVPLWRKLESGLLVPSSVSGGTPVRTTSGRIPPELIPPPRPVALIREPPHFSDKALARPSEDTLGLTSSTLADLARLASAIPFEPAIVVMSRLAMLLWEIHTDSAAQLELAKS